MHKSPLELVNLENVEICDRTQKWSHFFHMNKMVANQSFPNTLSPNYKIVHRKFYVPWMKCHMTFGINAVLYTNCTFRGNYSAPCDIIIDSAFAAQSKVRLGYAWILWILCDFIHWGLQKPLSFTYQAVHMPFKRKKSYLHSNFSEIRIWVTIGSCTSWRLTGNKSLLEPMMIWWWNNWPCIQSRLKWVAIQQWLSLSYFTLWYSSLIFFTWQRIMPRVSIH